MHVADEPLRGSTVAVSERAEATHEPPVLLCATRARILAAFRQAQRQRWEVQPPSRPERLTRPAGCSQNRSKTRDILGSSQSPREAAGLLLRSWEVVQRLSDACWNDLRDVRRLFLQGRQPPGALMPRRRGYDVPEKRPLVCPA